MKNYIFVLSIILTCLACKKQELPSLPAKSNPNLKYFGFTLIDAFWDDPSDKDEKVNYLDEVAHFSNIADMLVIDPETSIVDRLLSMQQNDVQAVIHVSELFFEFKSTGGDRSGSIYGLRDDYQQRWDLFSTVNDLSTNQSMIHSIYIGEEPCWNSIPEAEFILACDYVKQTFPALLLFTVEAPPVISEMYVPASIDYVGFDHYFLKQPSTDENYIAEYNIVKSKMTPSQKMIVILDAHWIKVLHGSSGLSKKDMDFVARDYYNLANSDTTVAGILGYFWPSGFDAEHSVGARNMPQNVKDEYERIGKLITGKP